MKYKFLLPIVSVIFFSSCSSIYKTTQTPDDVYYSPETINAITQTTLIKEQTEASNYFDNNYITHKVRNRNRWQTIDDYTYWNDTRYNHPLNWNSFNNNSFGGSCYNSYSNYYNGCSNPYLNNLNNWGFYNGSYGAGWNNPYQYNTPITTINTIKTLPNTNNLSYTNTKYNNTNYYYNPKTGASQGVNTANNVKFRTQKNDSKGESYSNPTRNFDNNNSNNTYTPPSKNAGGNSGGFNSKGSSSSKPRG